jgi:hypothetical protein
LRLVKDNGRWVHLQESPGVFHGGCTDVGRLEGHVPVSLAEEMLKKRRFAGLTRAGQNDRREFTRGLLQYGLERSFNVIERHGKPTLCNYAF